MKTVVYEEASGKLHRVTLPDSMEAALAEQGIPGDPPDINLLDWDALRIQLHNSLVKNDLFALSDLQRNDKLKNVILTTFQRPITNLYREKETREKDSKVKNEPLGGTK